LQGGSNIELYWSFIIFGVIFALVSLVFGEIIGHWMDGITNILHLGHLDFLQPLLIVGGITAFGASGLFYSSYFDMNGSALAGISLITAFIITILIYFLHLRKMKNTESSIAYSIQDMLGKIAIVNVPIPKEGYGEIIVKTRTGTMGFTATSMDKLLLKQGTRVVIVQLEGKVFAVSELKL
jgi:membrane protein implicated in regulation of membrane protease activity